MMDDWMKWRQIKMRALGKSYNDYVRCPVCNNTGKIRDMDCHHLIPKGVAPHLKYVADNLQFVHKSCHKGIHKFMGGTVRRRVKINGIPVHKMLKKDLIIAYLELEGYLRALEGNNFFN